MPDAELRPRSSSARRPEILALERDGELTGWRSSIFAKPGEVEIVMFGVVPDATGTGAARALMHEALAEAAQPGVGRVWLHTCTFDHPAAVRFYLGAASAPSNMRSRSATIRGSTAICR